MENYSFDELDFNSYTADVIVESNDQEFFTKCGEIQDKISELMDIDNSDNVIVIDDYGESIILDKEKNTSAFRGKYRNDIVFSFTSVINNSLNASQVQYCINK